jgi:hypothetical protein
MVLAGLLEQLRKLLDEPHAPDHQLAGLAQCVLTVSMGFRPPPITKTMTLPRYRAGPPPPQTGYESAKPKMKRSGWLGGCTALIMACTQLG